MQTYIKKQMIFFFVSMIIVSGCTKEPKVQEPMTLKVMAINEYTFNMNYGRFLAEKFPNLKIKVIATENADSDLSVAQLIEKEQPDVLEFRDIEMFRQMAENGRLAELDSLIRKTEFDIINFNPAFVEYMRSLGEGTLYGLSPEIDSQAVFYNKDLFVKNGIPFPQDGMSWEQLIQLAARFPTEEQTGTVAYGFYRGGIKYVTPYFGGLIEPIAESKGLKYVDNDKWQVTINTKEWKSVFQLALNAIQSKSVAIGKEIEPELFLEGKAAMTIGIVYNVSHLVEVQSEDPSKRFDWDMVTLPADPKLQSNASWTPGNIYGINAKSEHTQQAWDLIQFINGEEMAKELSDGVSLSSRTAYNKMRNGHDLSVFLKVPPSMKPVKFKDFPFYNTFREIANKHFEDVLGGNEQLDQAMKEIQEEGQIELEKVKLSMNKSP